MVIHVINATTMDVNEPFSKFIKKIEGKATKTARQYQPSPKDRLDETFSVENESILYPSCITMSSRTSLKTFLLKEFMLGSFNVSCFGPRRTRGLWRVRRGGPSPPFT